MRNMFLKDEDFMLKVKSVAYDIVNDWTDMGCKCDIMEFMKEKYIPLLTLNVECVADIKRQEREDWIKELKEVWINGDKSGEEN